MTSEQIAELRRLEREAAKPPWSQSIMGILGDGGNQYVAEYTKRTETPTDADAELIVTVRNALPRLLDEREALLNALTGLEVWITKNVSGGARIEALAVARQTLDKVCKP